MREVEKHFLEKLDRVITNKNIAVVTQEETALSSDTIAGTDMKGKVLINTGKICEIIDGHVGKPEWGDERKQIEWNVEYWRLIKGMNYHEISHLLYTPIFPFLATAEEVYAANMLEDQRTEALFCQKYPNAADYFLNNVLKLSNLLTYPVLYGRRFYLPRELIQASREAFKKKYTEQLTQQIEKIIDRYMVANTMEEMIECIKELVAIMNPDEIQRMSLDLLFERRPDENAVKRKLRVRGELTALKKKIEEEKKEEAEGSEEIKTEESGESEQKTAELLKDFEKEIKKRTEAEIIREIQDFSGKGEGCGVEQRKDRNLIREEYPTHPKLKEELRRALKVLRADLSSTYIRKQRRGRIDLRSALKARKNSSINIFRKYQPSRLSKMKQAVTILIDGSSSMSGMCFQKAMQGAWVLANALEEEGSKVMVLEYSSFSDVLVLKRWDGKLHTSVHYFCGGTVPSGCLEIALQELLKKRKEGFSNLTSIILTDGEWGWEENAEEIIRKMNGEEIETVEILIGGECSGHNSKHIIRVEGISELPKKMKKVIEEIAKNIRKRIQC